MRRYRELARMLARVFERARRGNSAGKGYRSRAWAFFAAVSLVVMLTGGLLTACGGQSPTLAESSPYGQAASPSHPGSPPASSPDSGIARAASAETSSPSASEASSSPDRSNIELPPAGEGADSSADTSRIGGSPPDEPSHAPSVPPAPPGAEPAASPVHTGRGDQPEAAAVTVSIAGNAEWGEVLKAEEAELKSGDTVGDVLIRVLKSHKLAYETRGAGALFYVVGIDGLFEFDDGPTSGWKYKVNGTEEDIGAGARKPKPGDRIEWYFVTEDEQAAGGTAS